MHVKRDDKQAKYWLEPTAILQIQHGFAERELNIIARLVAEHRGFLLAQWHEFFGQ